jgi:hypothetical protein
LLSLSLAVLLSSSHRFSLYACGRMLNKQSLLLNGRFCSLNRNDYSQKIRAFSSDKKVSFVSLSLSLSQMGRRGEVRELISCIHCVV